LSASSCLASICLPLHKHTCPKPLHGSLLVAIDSYNKTTLVVACTFSLVVSLSSTLFVVLLVRYSTQSHCLQQRAIQDIHSRILFFQKHLLVLTFRSMQNSLSHATHHFLTSLLPMLVPSTIRFTATKPVIYSTFHARFKVAPNIKDALTNIRTQSSLCSGLRCNQISVELERVYAPVSTAFYDTTVGYLISDECRGSSSSVSPQ